MSRQMKVPGVHPNQRKDMLMRNLPKPEHAERFGNLVARAAEVGCKIDDCTMGGEREGAPWAIYDMHSPRDFHHSYGLIAGGCDLDGLDEVIAEIEQERKARN